MTYGALKYEKNNWRKGFDYSSVCDSLERHYASWKEGEDFDAESGLPHLAHIAWNIAVLIEHWDKGLGNDDRIIVPAGRQLVFNDPRAS
jgi:hypothetical protein